MSKKVIIDFERLKNPYTGLYTFSKDLGQALLNNNTEELDLIFFIPKSEQKLFVHDKFKFYKSIYNYIKPLQKTSWHQTYQFSKYYSTSQPNLLTIHDLNFLIEKKDNVEKIKKYQKKVQRNIDRASHIVCISNFVANQIREYMKIDSQTIEVIYNGTIINQFENFNQPRYFPKNPFIFSIGSFFKKKNFHVLPNLLVGNDFELIIGGVFYDENYVEYIKQIAKELGVLDRVHLLNGISDQERDWYYKNCELFAFPSIAEGFGLPVVEAMKYGKKVLSSKECSLPEVGGEVAFYFENFELDAMQATLNKAIHTNNVDFCDKIEKQAEKFNWDDCAKQYLKLYKQL